MYMTNLLWQFVMKIRQDLTKSFRRAASRTMLVVVMAIGALTPMVSVQAPAPAAAAVEQTETVQAPTEEKVAPETQQEVQFTDVQDLDAFVKEYPVAADFRKELQNSDDERKTALKEMDREGDFYPGGFRVGKYFADGRSIVFIQMKDVPNQLSREGMPLSVYVKDGNEFHLAYTAMAEGPITVVSSKDNLVFEVSRGMSDPVKITYNAKTGQFDEPPYVAPVEQNAPDATPAPTPVPTPAPDKPAGPK